MIAQKRKEPEAFWREYEAKLGEKILAYTIGQYIRGWDELERPLWGLLMVSSGGFRFHHFPHESWLDALARTSTGGEAPKEKIIFIPKDRLIAAELKIETSWWKQLLFPHPPLLVICYLRDEGLESTLLVETEKNAVTLIERIKEIMKTP